MEILSNGGNQRLGDILKGRLTADAKLSIIASCFTIFAFGELKNELEEIEELRFIFSEPTFIKKMEALKDPREFILSKRNREKAVGGIDLELTLKNSLNQRALAKECARWVREKTKAYSAKRNNQIQVGSLYHLLDNENSQCGFSGFDAPFSLEGLGYEKRPGIVSPVTYFESTAEADNLKTQFESLWSNTDLIEDVTEELVAQIETLYRENSPEFIYFLTLYHIFKEFLVDEEDDPIKPGLNFESTAIWNKLFDFQKDAAVGAIRKLEKYKGCIIADSVGLGKTFEALAVIKYYELRNNRVLVMTPKRLRENWTVYCSNDERNPLVDDRLNYDVLNHTDLSRYSGYSGDINLETLRWGNYDLLVIDESHNFRNKPTDRTTLSRYDRLMNDIVKSGIRTKVLMLSATPVNNKLLDLRNQIEIITEGDDAYLDSTDGIASITQVTRIAQTRFKQWSDLPDEDRTTSKFIDMVNADYFRLLDILTIARSRKHISKYYTGEETSHFPNRLKPKSFSPEIDIKDMIPPISELNSTIASLSFAQYQLLDFLLPDRRQEYAEQYSDTWGKDLDSQINRTQAVANLMRVNVLKRLESSVYSFGLTIGKILNGAKALKQQLGNMSGAQLSYETEALADDFDDDEDSDEFVAGGKVKVDLRDVDKVRLQQELEYDIGILEQLLGYARMVTPERDNKLKVLREVINKKVSMPINDGNKKLLIFSAFADTASYLYEQLKDQLYEEYGLYSALVTGAKGSQTNLKLKRKTYDSILVHFSPVSKELPEEKRKTEGQIDIVFATDCISEGQNLQDCDCVVNYDIHWNPVRIIQRFGRVDRLGSINDYVQLINFWPAIELDEYIKLEARVKGRMVLLDTAATGEENLLEMKRNDEMNDLLYRRKQLEQLREEVLDLEDITGGISITDFAFDDFRIELQRYAKEHDGLLEKSAIGLHAVVSIPEDLKEEIDPGVVFCIKQNDETKNPKDTNPVFPYHLVYISNSGSVVTKHTQPKIALDILRGLCSGRKEPFLKLCAAFNRETGDGTKMTHYSDLLASILGKISGVQEVKGIESLFSVGEVSLSNVVTGSMNDYSLVTFVVVK